MSEQPEFSEDGLLPRVEDEEFEWFKPDFSQEPDPVRAAATWVHDIATQMHFVWPAHVGGTLTPPPWQHVLDRLIRSEVSGHTAEIETELMLHPDTGTVAVLVKLPDCDICKRDGLNNPARYDGPTGRQTTALWGNMCPDHYEQHSTGRLGIGEGQYLMLTSEIPSTVWDALEAARSHWAPWREEKRP